MKIMVSDSIRGAIFHKLKRLGKTRYWLAKRQDEFHPRACLRWLYSKKNTGCSVRMAEALMRACGLRVGGDE